jgi:hypothetical protein
MEYLKRFFLWFVSGLGLAAGVACVAWISNKVAETQVRQTVEVDILKPAPDFALSDVAPVQLTRGAAVAGTVTNNSSGKAEVQLNLRFEKDGKTLYECDQWKRLSPNPHMAMRFQIRCPEVDAERLPPGTQYVVTVQRVTHEAD